MNDQDQRYFLGRGEREVQFGQSEANTRTVLGHSYADEPDALIEQLKYDEAIAVADTLLLTVPTVR